MITVETFMRFTSPGRPLNRHNHPGETTSQSGTA